MRTGSRAIHGFLKQPEAQWARPFQHLPAQARMKARVDYWSGFWGRKDPAAQPTLIETQTKRSRHCRNPETKADQQCSTAQS